MPWVKGQSGNPNGRPRKKRALSNMLRTIGGQKTEEGITKRRALAQKVWEMALDGDLAAARLIYEYCDGKPAQKLEYSGTDGGAIEVRLTGNISPADFRPRDGDNS